MLEFAKLQFQASMKENSPVLRAKAMRAVSIHFGVQ